MAASGYRVVFEGNVPATMRDGARLYADVWRPDTPGRFPVILQRTPYDKTTYALRVGFCFDPLRAVQQGYVVIIQDTRGCFASEGEFHPFEDDYEDGYDTVEWAASLPYSNGQIGMFGASYVGATQWKAAIQQPPHLRAIFPMWCGDGPYEGLTYQGGVFSLGASLWWALRMAFDPVMRKVSSGEDMGNLLDHLLKTSNALPQACESLPLKGAYQFLSELVPSYDFKLDHPDFDEYWQHLTFSRYLEMITVPAYSVGGWFDIYAKSVPQLFSGMRVRGGSDVARNGQKLIMGPWPHGACSDQLGDIYFGTSSTMLGQDIGGIHLRWFDYWLKGIDNGIMDEPPVKIFVMGANVWRNENEWPLARTQWTNYYFHSNGQANSVSGNGRLGPERPSGEEVPDKYVYDPLNPVPTVGGNTILPGAACAANAGPKEQGMVEGRIDVLVYTTEPLTRDTEVTGPVTVKLFASTSARDTDWTAKLVDVHSDGRAYNVADGIVRARYRNGLDVPRLLEPGEVPEYDIDLAVTSNVFKAGHRIRVQISSSNFPRFDRNPNTGRTIATETEWRPAMQTVFHDAPRPSHIVLPIIPGHVT